MSVLLDNIEKMILLLRCEYSCLARFTHNGSVAGEALITRNNVILTDYWHFERKIAKKGALLLVFMSTSVREVYLNSRSVMSH